MTFYKKKKIYKTLALYLTFFPHVILFEGLGQMMAKMYALIVWMNGWIDGSIDGWIDYSDLV